LIDNKVQLRYLNIKIQTMMRNNDNLFSQPITDISDFSFDQNVAQVFPDMINRSIPGYPLMIDNIGYLSEQYAQDNSAIYDLGCATGIATLSIAKQLTKKCPIIGIDNSASMVEKCTQHLAQYNHGADVTICLDDITLTELVPASVIVMNFTLQFLAPEQRKCMLEKIYEALLPGGILILSEKFKEEDTFTNNALIDLHHHFKKNNGYSDLEISQKRTALENVMKTDSMATHYQRLSATGFSHITTWFSCFNFMSLIAYKE